MERQIIKSAKLLREDFKSLDDYQALDISIKLKQLELMKTAFNISETDKYPSVLEAISIQLGYSERGGSSSIPDRLLEVSENLSAIAKKK